VPDEPTASQSPPDDAAASPGTGLGADSAGAGFGSADQQVQSDPKALQDRIEQLEARVSESEAKASGAEKRVSDAQSRMHAATTELAQLRNQVAATVQGYGPTEPYGGYQLPPDPYGLDAGPYQPGFAPPAPPAPPKTDPLLSALMPLATQNWLNEEIRSRAEEANVKVSKEERDQIRDWLNNHATTDVDSAWDLIVGKRLSKEESERKVKEALGQKREAVMAGARAPEGTPSQPKREYPGNFDGIRQSIEDAYERGDIKGFPAD